MVKKKIKELLDIKRRGAQRAKRNNYGKENTLPQMRNMLSKSM